MKYCLPVRPRGRIAQSADTFMTPVMCVLMRIQAGTWDESPQETHIWNNQKLALEEVSHLKSKHMVSCSGITGAISAPSFFRHIPLTGWKQYVVLEPTILQRWHVGWRGSAGAGVSWIVLDGPVRMLLGPDDIQFFAVSIPDNEQIPLKEIGQGTLGDGGPYTNIRLL